MLINTKRKRKTKKTITFHKTTKKMQHEFDNSTKKERQTT